MKERWSHPPSLRLSLPLGCSMTLTAFCTLFESKTRKGLDGNDLNGIGPSRRDLFVRISALKEERCVLSAPRARPGIHMIPRAGLQVHVWPGIQVQAASVEPPSAHNPGQLLCRQQPVRGAHYIKLVFRRKTISFPTVPIIPTTPITPIQKLSKIKVI